MYIYIKKKERKRKKKKKIKIKDNLEGIKQFINISQSRPQAGKKQN